MDVKPKIIIYTSIHISDSQVQLVKILGCLRNQLFVYYKKLLMLENTRLNH